jgi:hypothetical protein
MNWVQEMKRRSINAEPQDIASADIQLAIENTDICKNLFDNIETSSKAADPGVTKKIKLIHKGSLVDL